MGAFHAQSPGTVAALFQAPNAKLPKVIQVQQAFACLLATTFAGLDAIHTAAFDVLRNVF